MGAADQLELQLARVEVASAETLILDAEMAASVAAGQLEDALQLPFPHLAALADASRAHVSSSANEAFHDRGIEKIGGTVRQDDAGIPTVDSSGRAFADLHPAASRP